MSDFILHPRLAADCHLIGDLGSCRVLLLDDRRYPWVVLVPRRSGLTEIYQMTPADRGELIELSCRVGESMMRTFGGDKLNLGALGNLVPQLHVHHVVRRVGDPAWPGPVWGHSAAEPYDADALQERLQLMRGQLGITG